MNLLCGPCRRVPEQRHDRHRVLSPQLTPRRPPQLSVPAKTMISILMNGLGVTAMASHLRHHPAGHLAGISLVVVATTSWPVKL